MSPCATCGDELLNGACLRCSSLEALGRVCFNQALALLKRGQSSAAEDALCAACALMPTRVEARRTLGTLRAQQGRYDAAVADLSRALRLAPGDTRSAAALAASQVQLLLRRWVVPLAVVLFACAVSLLVRFWR